MLSKLEQKIVDLHKTQYFSAYLQWAWLTYPELQKQINRDEYPKQDILAYANERMHDYKIDFDCYYLRSLPKEKVNPLKVEQEAWSLLSLVINQHILEAYNFIEVYSSKDVNKEQLLKHVNDSWDLLQKWDIISNSYKMKYGKVWTKIDETEQAAKKLIEELKRNLKY